MCAKLVLRNRTSRVTTRFLVRSMSTVGAFVSSLWPR
jgi:hypothetical protein